MSVLWLEESRHGHFLSPMRHAAGQCINEQPTDRLSNLRAAGHQKTQPPRARQKGWRWVLWVVVACLLLGGAGISWWAISMEQTRAGVTQTLQTYCNALQQADYTQAYAQWSSTIQMSESDFASLYTNKPHITRCSISTISLANTTAQATLTMLFADRSTTSGQYTLILIHGVWKIKSQLSR